jgi:alkylation response protein AidB-like acyl-CoA dehydrogenase
MIRMDGESTTGSEPARDHLERARLLAPDIAACADEIERNRRLSPALLASLIDGGFFRMLLPRKFSGAELDPLSFGRVIEEFARHDASTAWCLSQASGCSMVAAFLPPETADEIFGRDPRVIVAWGPGQGARAVAVDGGYRVTGQWAFASGGRHATWLGGQCQVFERDLTPRRAADGATVSRTLLMPASEVAMTDIWHVIGLKGTASDAFAVTDFFVPERRAVARDDQSERRYQGPLYGFPTNSLYATGFSSVALGIARSTLDAFIHLCRDKSPRGFKGLLRDNAVIQSQVAQAEARLGAARMFLHGSLEEIWEDVERTNRVTIDQRMRIRLAATHAITEATAVVDVIYHAAGTTSVFASSAFERRFRDIHTVTQQIQGRQSHFETVGQFLLGLEPDTAFL